jgi:hypothetical protein
MGISTFTSKEIIFLQGIWLIGNVMGTQLSYKKKNISGQFFNDLTSRHHQKMMGEVFQVGELSELTQT